MASLFIAIAACSGEGKVDGPVLTSPPQPLVGAGRTDAQVSGEVVFDEDIGCLFLGRGNRQVPVVWPHGARWQAEPPAVKLQGKVIEPGMSVEGGGGYLNHNSVEQMAGTEVADAARACTRGFFGEIAFFNRSSKVEVLSD